MLRTIFIAVFATMAAAIAQQTPAGGIASEWDIHNTLKTLNRQNSQLLPILDSLKVKDWIAAGASSVYGQQLESAKSQMQSFAPVVVNLGRNVEKLSAVLDVYFRLQSLDSVLGSLTEGVTKYQNPALGELLQGINGEYYSARQQLRQYMTDLAAIKEQELELMDREAQRCRGSIVRQQASPAPPAPKPAKKP